LSESHSVHTQHICELDSDSSASSSVFKAPVGNVSRKSSRCKRKHLINFKDAANPCRITLLSNDSSHQTRHIKFFGWSLRNQSELNPSSSSSKNSFTSANLSSVTNPICLDKEMDCHLSTELASGLKHSNLSDNIDDEEDHMMIDEPISSQNNPESPLLKAVIVTNITCSFAQGLQAKLVNKASGLKQSNLSNNIDEEEDRIMMNEPISSPTNLKSPLLKAICVNDHKCPFAQGLQAKQIGQSVDSPKGSFPYNKRNALTSPKKKTRLNSSPSKNKWQNSSTSKSVTSMSKKNKRMGKIAFNNHEDAWC